MKALLTLTKLYFKLMTAVNPELAASKAFRFFETVRSPKMKRRELDFFENAKYFTVHSDYGDIKVYESGNVNGKTIILIHGWESNAGSMAGVMKELSELGYHVISFDLPAHGFHGQKRTNLKECTSVMCSVLNRIRTDHPISIVSHSFGSFVTANALYKTNKSVDQLLFLTSPDTSRGFFESFRDTIDLPNSAYEHLIKKAENLLQEALDEVTIIKRLKKASYKKLTIIHDQYDKVIPFSNSERISTSLEKTELLRFERIGHYRMLWNNRHYYDLFSIGQLLFFYNSNSWFIMSKISALNF